MIREEEFFDGSFRTLQGKVRSFLISERKKRGMTQFDFARMIGVSRQTLIRIENDQVEISMSTLARICDKLGVMPVLDFIFVDRAIWL